MRHGKFVNQVLNTPGSGLSTILQRASHLRRLTVELQNLLDAPLKDHIYVANVRENTLIIGTDSAIWHSRIKYLAPIILDHLQSLKGWAFLKHIEFRVQPHMLQLTHPGNVKEQDSDEAKQNRLSQRADHKHSAQIKKALDNLS